MVPGSWGPSDQGRGSQPFSRGQWELETCHEPKWGLSDTGEDHLSENSSKKQEAAFKYFSFLL